MERTEDLGGGIRLEIEGPEGTAWGARYAWRVMRGPVYLDSGDVCSDDNDEDAVDGRIEAMEGAWG